MSPIEGGCEYCTICDKPSTEPIVIYRELFGTMTSKTLGYYCSWQCVAASAERKSKK